MFVIQDKSENYIPLPLLPIYPMLRMNEDGVDKRLNKGLDTNYYDSFESTEFLISLVLPA